jgi:phosphoglycerol transferase MdoB-like AlkP superfamily enzyme
LIEHGYGHLLLPVLVFCASLGLHIWMAEALNGPLIWTLQGACRDALPGTLMAAALQWSDRRSWPRHWLTALLSIWAVALLVLCAIDGVYFYQTGHRLERTLLDNLEWTSLKVAINTASVLAALALVALFFSALAYAVKLVRRPVRVQPRGRWLTFALTLAIFIGAVSSWLQGSASRPTAGNAQRQFIGKELASSQASDVLEICQALHKTGAAWQPPAPCALQAAQQDWARQHGLADGQNHLAVRRARVRRVVVIAVESLALAFIDPANPRRPQGMTPFLESLQARYPHLQRCYSAGVETDQGQFALMAGRTDYEWNGHYFPASTLPDLAAQAGYQAIMLHGSTRDFRAHNLAYPATLHIQQLLSKEDFIGRRPAQDFYSWGGALGDRGVLEEALNIVQEHRRGSLLLLVDTLDTHPPYFWQLPESAFPQAVRRYPGGLAKALYQLDRNLEHFYRRMQKRGLLDGQTLLVITADHAPVFDSEPLAMSGAADYRTAPIPMIFIGPAKMLGPNFNQNRLASQLDLPPTLAELMGLPIPASFMGRSLLAPGPDRALSREREMLRLRQDQGQETDILLDPCGQPGIVDSPFAAWYRAQLSSLEPIKAYSAQAQNKPAKRL